MSWSETHRRWQALQEIEEAANADLSGALPWKAEYAEIFGGQANLLAFLRYRWDLARNSQIDPGLTIAQQESLFDRLEQRNAGVLRILARAQQPESIPA